VLKTVAVVLLVALYAIASHFSLILPGGKSLAAALAICIPAVALLALAFQFAGKWFGHKWLAAVLAVALVTAILVFTWPHILNNADHVYFTQHLGTNAVLAWVFGHTLAAGKTPLVVQFAKMVHTNLPAPIEAYARQVTVAWVVFFLVTCALSVLLYFATPLSWWSTFGVLLQWPSVGAFFVAEYAFRRWRFRDFDHASMKAGFEAYRQHQAGQQTAVKPVEKT
jgi:uncharacterized membrane protein